MTFISSHEVKKCIFHSCLRHSWNIHFVHFMRWNKSHIHDKHLNILYILVRQKMIYDHCSSLTFLTDQFLCAQVCFHLVLLTCSKTKISQLIFLFCCFISALLRSIMAPKSHAFSNFSWIQDISFYMLHRFYILHHQLIRMSDPPSWIFITEPCNYVTVWHNA